MFYRIKNNKLYDYADYKYAVDCLETNIITQSELSSDKEKVIINDGVLIINPNYQDIVKKREEDRINALTMTPLDFIKFLEDLGITYSEIQAYLTNHQELDKQLKYCQNVYCGVVKQLLPLTVGNVVITTELVERAFKAKYGEE